MSEHTDFYVGLFTRMHQSGQDYQSSQEKIEQAWRDLQSVPSYVERYQRDRQFCEHGQYRTLCPECSPLA